ncbi:hypothetical protein R0131_13315 [Clostridium sp. AL.422]|uniref:hypothetical protein n=1 Tax=Clostridium TaxID=1485 RepID=UPI00293DF72D|nr:MULTISPECIES: hypothetical protein [unclassified Clostridium]MDV4151801.1 hypothetical protein [Clostridium sp. AL.422]
MENIYVKDIITIMTKYCEILKVIRCKNLNSQLKDIDKIINYISLYSDISLEDMRLKLDIKDEEDIKSSNKQSFIETINLLDSKEFKKISGIKLKYNNFNNKLDIVEFIESKSKEEILKSTTLIDLNLIYYLLNGNKKFIKIKKEEIYNNIISYIKAMKQGEAFKKYI